jgi:hypothetical protein
MQQADIDSICGVAFNMQYTAAPFCGIPLQSEKR